MPPTSSVIVVRAIARALDAMRPGRSTMLMATLGVTPATLDDPDGRIAYSQVLRAWETAADLAEDPDFGLHATELAPVGTFGVLDYVTASCRTLRDAFEAFSRFQRIVHDAVQITFQPDAEVTRVRHVVSGFASGVPRHAVEASLGTWVVRASTLLGAPLMPVEVWFQHPRPPRTSEHRRVFACPVHFSAPHTEMALLTSVLDRSLQTADPALASIMRRQASAIIAALPQVDVTASAVRQVLATGMEGGDAGLARVASQMGMSPRTLQRTLASEGTTLAAIRDELRREIAASYVQAGELSLAEIAFVLGFSEVSAFHRAYRRWTGRAPGLDRGRQAAAVSRPGAHPRRAKARRPVRK